MREASSDSGRHDRDTLLLVTSVTSGLEGGPGRAVALWDTESVSSADSDRKRRGAEVEGKKRDDGIFWQKASVESR